MESLQQEFDRVEKRFQDWRDHRTKRSPIPQELWEEAYRLSQKVNPCKVSQRLRINYGGLKKVIAQKSSRPVVSFSTVELCGANNLTALASTMQDVSLELEGNGRSIRLQLGQIHEMALIRVMQQLLGSA